MSQTLSQEPLAKLRSRATGPPISAWMMVSGPRYLGTGPAVDYWIGRLAERLGKGHVNIAAPPLGTAGSWPLCREERDKQGWPAQAWHHWLWCRRKATRCGCFRIRRPCFEYAGLLMSPGLSSASVAGVIHTRTLFDTTCCHAHHLWRPSTEAR